MKSFKNILISLLFIIGYAFSTQVVAGTPSSSSSMSDETHSAQESTQQTECGMSWTWD